jgi:ABC-2 type transport system permease protein
LSNLAVVAAFLRRDLRINVSYRAAFAFQGVSILLQVALFFYLSHIVNGKHFAEQEGLTGGYFGYAAVGLALLTMVQVSLSSYSYKLREEQTTGTFEALMATPRSPSLIVLSGAIYDLIRATITGLVLIAAAVVIFGLRLALDPESLGLALIALLGCLGLFASLGVVVAAFTVVIKRATALLGMMIAGLALLGGVYFPISVLPAPLEQLANILPFTWALDVVRAALLGGDVDPAQLAGLYAAVAVLLPIALFGFTLAVKRARRTGTLSQY